jgi:nascent polypeptide-associated complex subunit alpha
MADTNSPDYDAQIDNDKKLNKAEKKARKALAKLGLKPVANVSRVTMKKNPSILFLIRDPEVYKSPAGGGQETYVVYGQCQIDDGNQRRGPSFPQRFADPKAVQSKPAEEEEDDDEMPEMKPADAAGENAQISAEGLNEKDIEMVMSQVQCDRKKAIETLKKNGGDIINSIMDLTM